MMKKSVTIMEVCPRDGWQNLATSIPLETKLKYVRGMLDTGVKIIQIGSFVSPRAVPQMATTGDLARAIVNEYPDVEFNALVPNLKGAQLAHDAGIRSICYVMSATEGHNQANIGKTREKSLEDLKVLTETMTDMNICLSLSTAFGCPFEGETPAENVLTLVEKGAELGIKWFELGDTIGSAAPGQVINLFGKLKTRYPEFTFMAHMHDTRNNGILNSWLAAMNGADIVHTALGGLGGCPFAPGASGNTATEDFVYLLEKSGIETGVDLQKVIALAKSMREEIDGVYSGHQINIRDDVYERACQTKALQN